MKTFSVRSFLLLTALFVAALGFMACNGDDGDGDTFRIGVMESLTGPGETYGNRLQPS